MPLTASSWDPGSIELFQCEISRVSAYRSVRWSSCVSMHDLMTSGMVKMQEGDFVCFVYTEGCRF